jgi:uncharacterized membrane protein YphA (DoxX/SURF4 family)
MTFSDIVKRIINGATACYEWIKGAILKPAGTLVWVALILVILHVAKVNLGFFITFLVLLFNLFCCVMNYIHYKTSQK